MFISPNRSFLLRLIVTTWIVKAPSIITDKNIIVIAGAQNPWELQMDSAVSAEYDRLRNYIHDNCLPVLAEPGSSLRYMGNAISGYGIILPYYEQAIEAVIVVGHPTLHRSVSRLISRMDKEVYIFEPEKAAWHEEGKNPGILIASVDALESLGADGGPNSEGRSRRPPELWLADWKRSAEQVRQVLEKVPVDDNGGSGYHSVVVSSVIWEALKWRSRCDRSRETRLFLGPSNSVRDLDLMMDDVVEAGGELADPVALPVIYTNRGLAGIDGLVSTAQGIALAAPRAPYTQAETLAMMGDISFLHDIGGLFVGAAEIQPSLTILALNDRGGGIFSRLEHGNVARRNRKLSETVERYFSTPQYVDFANIARGYGVEHQRIETLLQLAEALKEPVRGRRRILEIPVDRKYSRRLYAGIQEEVGKLFPERN